MRTIFTATLLCLVCMFLSQGNVNAQVTSADFRNLDSTSVIKVTLNGGSAYEGKYVRQTSVRLVNHVTGSGDMSFLFSDIKLLNINGLSSVRPDSVVITLADSSKIVLVSLKDGSVLVGTLVSKSEAEIVLMTAVAGRLTISTSQIKSITVKEPEVPAVRSKWLPNTNPTRYFFAPSAFNLKKGEGYYQNAYVDINLVNYGLTDWFSIGGGLEVVGTFLFLSQGEWMPIWALTPKVGFPVGKNVHIGGGFMGGAYKSRFYESGDLKKSVFGLGIPYAVFTYGNLDNNITLGFGLPMSTKQFITDKYINPPILVLNGMYRVSQKVSIISENWFLTRDTGKDFIGFNSLFGYGIRLSGETMSFDFGFANNSIIAKMLIIGVPYVDFVYRFSKRKK